MTFVSQWKGESYSLERGDVMKVQAGVVRYLINPDENEKFSAAMLVNPVNTPGKFRVIRNVLFSSPNYKLIPTIKLLIIDM